MIFNKESDFEEALITLLFDKGWSPEVIKYPTEEDLRNNWASIIFSNNNSVDRLNDQPLTKGEMDQIIEKIKELRTPLKLNGLLTDETIQIKRDNPDDELHFGKEISLTIFYRDAIAGGRSTYQIAQQPIFKAKSPMLQDRRGDFMLLICGIPVIHVELKRSNIPVSQACYQIQKYSHEGVFTGLFAMIQIFVAMNPDEAVYFANPGPDGVFNPDYYFHWADTNNEPINDWQGVASTILSIPLAHQMVGQYSVADDTDGVLKIMRSYQYEAASAISLAVKKHKWDTKDQRGGYICHTTGSGKTMTSFKSAQLIANSRDADKVIFLMDRIELGTQSLLEYRGFAREKESVQATENTAVLETKMKSDEPADTLIVTSIQKMSRITEEGGFKASSIEKMRNKRIVFVIDECHRDVFGEMLRKIKDTFPMALFFGFTGTPIYDENKKKLSTTVDVFGDELHRYSIADGIRDENVLGFDPTMVLTYKDKELRECVALEKAKSKTVEEALSTKDKSKKYYEYMNDVPMAGTIDETGKYHKGIEDYIPHSQYDDEKQGKKHRNSVIADIKENWITLSRNGKFHAIFATSSIPEAIMYYRLFKSEMPDLKVTALFDKNIDNDGKAIFKEDGLVEILEDYNNRYSQKYSIPTYGDFKKDVSLRLAHKKHYSGIENSPEKQLDLLIVVDQMLTGFDSKWVNTLYLDKLLEYEHLVQAFSRTNRLFDKSEKPFGIVRYYRYPHTMERNIKEAFRAYSGDKPYGIFAQKLEQNLLQMNKDFRDIDDLFKLAGIENFERNPDSDEERREFIKLFHSLNAHLQAAIIQDFTWKKLEYKFKHGKKDNVKVTVSLAFDENIYLTLLIRYKELFKPVEVGENPPYDIDSHLIEKDTERIDKNYMNSNFKKFLKALQDGNETEAILNELHKSFSILTQEEQKYANMLLLDIQKGNIKIEDTKSLSDYINEYAIEAHNDRVHRFAVAIGINEEALRSFMERHVTSDNLNEFGLFDKLLATVDIPTAQAYFEKVEGAPVKRIKVKLKVDKLLRQFILIKDFDID